MLRYSVNKATAYKWLRRDDFNDRSRRPATLQTTLRPEQEAIVVAPRTSLLLPLDDLLAITRAFINPAASRSGLDRLLQREGIGNLRALIAAQTSEGEVPEKKGFKDYEPGYFHMEVAAADAGRNVAQLSVRRHRPRYALGVLAGLSGSKRKQCG